MNAWHKDPPTYQEWREKDNHGMWWVKFLLCEEHSEEIDEEIWIWPEAWYTDVVAINVSFDRGQLLDPEAAHLHAHGQVVGSIDLDDPEQTKNMYWQPVVPPLDDERDKRPEIVDN